MEKCSSDQPLDKINRKNWGKNVLLKQVKATGMHSMEQNTLLTLVPLPARIPALFTLHMQLNRIMIIRSDMCTAGRQPLM